MRSRSIPARTSTTSTSTKTCPNAVKVSGDLDASIFNAGSQAEGYITRFKPSMVEVQPDGTLTTPSVWDLHLHHVVWLRRGFGPTFASGEEKTIAVQPQGYGLKVGATENWGLNQMIHNLNATDGRSVYITWEIDWVPETTPARTDIKEVEVQWLDVAGSPQIYPVFDAEKGFDLDGDGKWTFPDDVPTDPSQPGYEERGKISEARNWTVPKSGATLVFGAGHLHPGGKRVDLKVGRDGPDPGTVPGDSEGEVKRLFRSDARYYEPAGAVSWDVAMEATPREWRVSLKPGDKVYVSTTYDVRRASWYESMGIMPLSWTTEPDPAARDPWDNPEEVKAMYKVPGVLTHRRLKENIDFKARKNLGLPDPRTLKAAGPVPQAGIPIRSFYFTSGGYSAVQGFPAEPDAPADHQVRRAGDFHQRGRGLRDVERGAGLAQHHVLPRPLHEGLGHRLPARERADQVRLGPDRLRHRHQLRRDDPDRHLVDAAADDDPRRQAGNDLHVLLPDPPLHARLSPSQEVTGGPGLGRAGLAQRGPDGPYSLGSTGFGQLRRSGSVASARRVPVSRPRPRWPGCHA